MPTYDYECRKCGKKFSVTLSMSQHGKKRVKCPKCQGTQTAQRVSAFFAITGKKS